MTQASGFVKQLVPLGLILALQKVDIEKEGYLLHAQVTYAVVQTVCIVAWLTIYNKIQRAEKGKNIKVPEVKQLGQVVKPAQEVSIKTYDMDKWKEQMQQLVVGAVILGFIHYKWAVVLPLVMQAVMTPLQIFDHPLMQIYGLGKAASGPLKRPFASANPFGLPTAPAPMDEEEEEDQKTKPNRKKERDAPQGDEKKEN